ncbi:MAG: DUF2461 domain-containing protein [Muribaculaceae bacterium]|nr:DUF2461 domain-containing protein [Muribaculaceae bacterium]
MNAFEFLEGLAANNNREWFAAHRGEYEAVREWWIAGIQRVIDAMAADYEPSFAGLHARDCIYRINRNLRFSQDKTPYKTHLAALISPHGRRYEKACYYIHLGLDDNGLYAGVWCPDSAMLRKLRNAIVDNIEEFEEILENPNLEKDFPGWCGRSLKTIPQGWPKDHPQAHLLRLQEYGKYHRVDRSFYDQPDWPERAAAILKPTKAFNDFLNYSIDEEL